MHGRSPHVLVGRSLYTRLVVRVGAVLLVSAVVLLIAIWISTQLAARQAYDRILAGSALQIAENTWYDHGEVNVDVPLAALSMLGTGDHAIYAVFDPHGRVIAGDGEFRPEIPWNELEQGPLLRDGDYLGTPVRMAIIGRRMPVDSPHPWAVIVLAQTNNARMSFAQSLGGKALVVIVVMSALTILAAMFTLYQALAPLKRIEAAIRERDLNDLSPLSLTVPAETHALVSAINAFMERLVVHRATMRRVIGDAAHQLRTPVTALVAQMELLATESSEDKRQRHLAQLRERTRNLGALVNQLINHAMVQHRNDNRLQERIALAELVRSQMTEVLSNRSRTPPDLALDVPPLPCLIQGDPIALGEAIKNILDNALQYGAPGLLHVRLDSDGRQHRLSFIDDGPGIAARDWERLRKPFAPRGENRMGASLGLSIVEEVMRAHGGQMRFDYLPDGHFAVVLEFPAWTEAA
ncbi:transmembrane sensor histidine kinase transcription regulator protein [Herbaspirillum sp. GW103]|jgi:two-component system sensor histidine kinase TctE|uniref:sensor histidine kinase n=1 Tax=Herbaspirillum sp. GW103 TaxID=1175306 RepID=UPI00025E3E1A|nr:sensor histidine kinase N-terminal domain-containing protein [Herbaspirillum sp. GW103]EIJ47750.1 transmembrane sensor histidine kinase transcription regulator protein [Herbaspirillum sp. GW103]